MIMNLNQIFHNLTKLQAPKIIIVSVHFDFYFLFGHAVFSHPTPVLSIHFHSALHSFFEVMFCYRSFIFLKFYYLVQYYLNQKCFDKICLFIQDQVYFCECMTFQMYEFARGLHLCTLLIIEISQTARINILNILRIQYFLMH